MSFFNIRYWLLSVFSPSSHGSLAFSTCQQFLNLVVKIHNQSQYPKDMLFLRQPCNVTSLLPSSPILAIRGQRYMFSDVTRGMPLNVNFILVYKQFSASAPKPNYQKCLGNMVCDGEKNACKVSKLSNKKLLN